MHIFGIILTAAVTSMHCYVFWRAASVPFIKRRVSTKILMGTAIDLWVIFLIGRFYGHGGTGSLAAALEMFGMCWMGILLLIFVCLLAVDVITAFGFVLKRSAPWLRGFAIIAGAILSIIAFVQGIRAPIIVKYDVNIAALPADMDGKVIVALSDLHIGSLIGEKWLADRVAQVRAEKPDLIVLLGDIVEGHRPPSRNILNILHGLSAPLGVWAVFGNHESYGQINKLRSPIEEDGFKALVDSWVEISPGLILSGVDDLTVKKQTGRIEGLIAKTLQGRPAGATILLSHTPWEIGEAADAGVDLMLCGHTHGGQIWPFEYLIKLQYPFFQGLYHVGDMTLIVSRGTGTWGPRMRLWQPGEILRVTLHKG